MPDNRAIEIYRKDREDPIRSLVRSVERVDQVRDGGMPYRIDFKAEDGRGGTIFVNAKEVEAVIISPAGVPDEE